MHCSVAVQFRTEPAGFVRNRLVLAKMAGSVLKPAGSVQNRSFSVRTGLGPKLVRLASFTGFGPILVTLVNLLREVW